MGWDSTDKGKTLSTVQVRAALQELVVMQLYQQHWSMALCPLSRTQCWLISTSALTGSSSDQRKTWPCSILCIKKKLRFLFQMYRIYERQLGCFAGINTHIPNYCFNRDIARSIFLWILESLLIMLTNFYCLLRARNLVNERKICALKIIFIGVIVNKIKKWSLRWWKVLSVREKYSEG